MYTTTYEIPPYKPIFLNAFFNKKELAEQEFLYKVFTVLRKVQSRLKTKSKVIPFADARMAICPRLGISRNQANILFEGLSRAGYLEIIPFHGLLLLELDEERDMGYPSFWCETIGRLVNSCNDNSCESWLACHESREIDQDQDDSDRERDDY
jgi:hypothetical protein